MGNWLIKRIHCGFWVSNPCLHGFSQGWTGKLTAARAPALLHHSHPSCWPSPCTEMYFLWQCFSRVLRFCTSHT